MSSGVRGVVKQLLHAIAPGWADRFFDQRRRDHIRRLEDQLGVTELSRRFLEGRERTVQEGPFAGMRYIEEATGSVLVPKLVGSYEAELIAPLERLLTERAYETVLDIGSAEGYYAIGLALRLPSAKVTAYDTSEHARTLTRAMATLNKVDARVEVKGEATAEELGRKVAGHTLIVCDCDGAEMLLLDPQKAPDLAHADILVETHDFLAPGTQATLLERFAATHAIQDIPTQKRDPGAYPALSGFTDAERALMLDELRPSAQIWLLMTTKAGDS